MNKIDEVTGLASANVPLSNPSIGNIPSKEATGSRQILPAPSIMASVQEAFAGVDSSALQETLEGMSLSLGSRLKDLRRRNEDEGPQRSQQALVELVSDLDDPMLIVLVEKFAQLGEQPEHPLALLQAADIPLGAQLLLLSSLLADKRLSDKRRQRLEQALASLLEGDDWELQLFGYLEMGQISGNALSQLRTLYQRSRREDQPQQGLAEWFANIKEWPDRQQRIRILLRALSFDLSTSAEHNQQIRLAATINDLKRLLLFLGLEEYCTLLGREVALSNEQVLSEILLIIEQPWISPEWLAERLQLLELPEQLHANYLRCLKALLRLLPDPCFKDLDQKEQILKALMTVQDHLDQQVD